MTTHLIDLVDLVADRLSSLGLPLTEEWRYAERRGVQPEHCPFLGVWPIYARYALVATDGTYSRQPQLRVRYAEDSSFGTETGGVGDDDVALAALGRAEAIIAALSSLTTEVADDWPVIAIDEVEYDIRGPLWVMDIRLEVLDVI